MMQPQRPLYVLSGTKVLPFVVILSFSLLNAAQVTAGGAWTKVLSYDAYGNALGFDPSTAITSLQYNTESYDANTGMQYLRSRWYDPSSGRFASLDSFAGSADSPQSLNGYGYCWAGPINGTDPSGQMPLLPFASGATCVVSAIQNYAASIAWLQASGSTSDLGTKLAEWGVALGHAFFFAMDMTSAISIFSGGVGGGMGGAVGSAGGGAVLAGMGNPTVAAIAPAVEAEAATLAAYGLRGLIDLALGLVSSNIAGGTGGGGGGGNNSAGESDCAPTRVTGDALAKARQEFEAMKPKAWMEEAARNPQEYTPEQLARMNNGQAPIGEDGFPMEIHHRTPLAEGGENSMDNFDFMTRTDHRLGPNYKGNHPNLP